MIIIVTIIKIILITTLIVIMWSLTSTKELRPHKRSWENGEIFDFGRGGDGSNSICKRWSLKFQNAFLLPLNSKARKAPSCFSPALSLRWWFCILLHPPPLPAYLPKCKLSPPLPPSSPLRSPHMSKLFSSRSWSWSPCSRLSPGVTGAEFRDRWNVWSVFTAEARLLATGFGTRARILGQVEVSVWGKSSTWLNAEPKESKTEQRKVVSVFQTQGSCQ